MKQHHIRIVDFASVLGFVQKVRHRGNALEYRSASWPLSPTRRTERGLISLPWAGLAAEQSLALGRACLYLWQQQPAPLSEASAGYMLV